MSERPSIAFVGAGRVARILAPAIAAAGYPVVAIASRTPASAEAVASRVPGSRACSVQEAADAAGLVLITTNDGGIGDAAAGVTWVAGKAAVHCSGATGLEPLAPAAGQGAAIGSWHPYQTFGAEGTATSLEGVTFGIEAQEPLRTTLWELTEALGGLPLYVPAEARALYHASSVMACGYLTTLLHEATQVWERAGLPPESAMPAIGRIAEATLANLRAAGAQAGLTGPISRGDVGTVEKHLAGFEAAAADLLPLYIALSERSVELAREAGRPGGDVDWKGLFDPHRHQPPPDQEQEA